MIKIERMNNETINLTKCYPHDGKSKNKKGWKIYIFHLTLTEIYSIALINMYYSKSICTKHNQRIKLKKKNNAKLKFN